LRSRRLNIVLENLNPRQDVWDFCCDHGYLGTEAYQSQKFCDIYFVDQVESIISKLKARFQMFAYLENSNSKAFFMCEPAQSLKQPVTGTVCITGVGGLMIYEILKQLGQAKFLHADRIILGPHRDNEKLIKLIEADPYLKPYQLQNKIQTIEKDRTRWIYIYDRVVDKALLKDTI
jgi:tRNA (adenine22-N1)-methyltransferase